MMLTWEPDPRSPDWELSVLTLEPDAEGPVVATLLRLHPTAGPLAANGAPRPTSGRAVLYVHGFNDYVFQTHLALAWQYHGYTFYGLDLRKCGRSRRSWQTPHYCTDLAEYLPELNAAARAVRGELGHDRLVVHGHSTGGLIVSLWAHSLRSADVIDALVLNSPWFDLNARWFRRVVSTRVVNAVGPHQPMRIVAQGRSAYSHHLHVSHGGRWDYDQELKPPEGFPARAGWLRAVRQGQARVSRGLQIACPVLVCTSTSTGPNAMDNPELDRQDTVVDVEQVAALAGRLGADVTLERIADAVHDLALSAPGPRAAYFATVFGWLAERERAWSRPRRPDHATA